MKAAKAEGHKEHIKHQADKNEEFIVKLYSLMSALGEVMN